MQHKFRHILSILLILAMLLPTTAMCLSAAEESEENNTLADADEVEFGESVTGEITGQDKDIFKIELSEAGLLTINVTSYIEYYSFYIYNESGNEIYSSTTLEWDHNIGQRTDAYSFYYEAGVYYFCINGHFIRAGYHDRYYEGSYKIDVGLKSSETTNIEPNNSFAESEEIILGQSTVGQISENDNDDFYKFTILKPDSLTIYFNSYMESYSIFLYNENMDEVFNSWNNEWGTSNHAFNEHKVQLSAGTYYVKVNGLWRKIGYHDRYKKGTYNFTILRDSSTIFTDVPADAWFKQPTDFCITKNLFNGTSTTTFSPDIAMDRAMLVTVLWRLAGNPRANVALPFIDVEDSWYIDAVKWAYANGIVNGTSDTTFSPTASVTREQIATILYRYASSYKNYDTSASANLYSFPDGNKTNDFAWDALSWANGAGLINGANYGGGIVLDPQGKATRSQVAKILAGFWEKYE